jgi:hypothetical protein
VVIVATPGLEDHGVESPQRVSGVGNVCISVLFFHDLIFIVFVPVEEK